MLASIASGWPGGLLLGAMIVVGAVVGTGILASLWLSGAKRNRSPLRRTFSTWLERRLAEERARTEAASDGLDQWASELRKLRAQQDSPIPQLRVLGPSGQAQGCPRIAGGTPSKPRKRAL